VDNVNAVAACLHESRPAAVYSVESGADCGLPLANAINQGHIQGKKSCVWPRLMLLLLVTEDGGSYCWTWRSEDAGTRRIKLSSMKMKTCHYWQILQQQQQQCNHAMHAPTNSSTSGP